MQILANHVHCWHDYNTTYPELNASEQAILSADEWLRANRFQFDIHRKRYVSAHVKLRKILALYLKCFPKDIVFSKKQCGKPIILYPETALQFNLSHSEDYFVLAIHPNTDVGIDVEYIRPTAPLKLAKRYFSENELNELMHCSNGMINEYFFVLWTAKEAILKADGQGLHAPLNSFTVDMHSNHQFIDFNEHHWQLITYKKKEQYQIALACQASVIEMIEYGFDNNEPLLQHKRSLTSL